MHQEVWALVCLAAVAAMEHGHAMLWALGLLVVCCPRQRWRGWGTWPPLASGTTCMTLPPPSRSTVWDSPLGHCFVVGSGNGLRHTLPARLEQGAAL